MTFKDFICPFTKSNLKLNNKKKFLINKSDNKFYIKNNLVNFLKLKKLDLDEKQIKKDYDDFSENYDKWINWMFKSFKENDNELD